MASLYEINEAMLDCVDVETGELDEGKYSALKMERDEKVRNTALWVIDLAADEKMYADREREFAERKKRAKALRERLKGILARGLNGAKVKTPDFAISWRKSLSVEVTNAMDIPEKYLIAQVPKIDKMLIKTAMKNGERVPGAELVEKNNIQIK